MTRPRKAADTARLIALILGASLALASCSSEKISRVEREKLFTLQYGRFEDELDLFGLDSGSTGPDTRIAMQDGLFYVANSGSQKIIQLTSFGDLLSVYYNADTNPLPSFAREENPDASGEIPDGSAKPADEQPLAAAASTRKAIAYPFIHPTFLAVNSLKRLYVVDQLPPERQEFDNDDQVALRDVVLRFNSDGSFLDYLGQEGPGGTAFPPINGVYVNSRNETIVTAKTQGALNVFLYNPEGLLLFRVPISFKGIPNPYDKERTTLATLETAIPDRDSHRLYLKIDYYTENIDSETGSNAGISYDRSCVYPFDIDSGKYLNRIDIPSYEGSEKGTTGTVAFKKPYEFLGITSSGWLFLITPQEGGYALEITDSRSRRSLKRLLSVSDEELAYNALALSPDGIISALLATQYEASLVWWRTDALIGEIRR